MFYDSVKGRLIAGLLFSWASLTHAESSLGLFMNYADWDYTEYDQSGNFLDTDSGGLWGGGINYTWQSDAWVLVAEIQRLKNRVDYRSVQTNSEVDTRIDEFSLATGRKFEWSEKLKSIFTLGLARRDWQRNIATALPYFGLYEDYAYEYYFLEATGEYMLDNQSSIYMGYRYKDTFEASVDVIFLSGDFDPIELPLKNSSGDEIKIGWRSTLGNQWSLGIEANLENWDFPRSDSVRLNRAGSPVSATVAEPESESQRVSGKLIFSRSFF